MIDKMIEWLVIPMFICMVLCMFIGTGLLVAVAVAFLTGHYS